MGVTILWFRRDLRLADNPSVTHAATSERPVVPLWVEPPAHTPGAAAARWRAASLASLDEALRAAGSRLVVREGPAAERLCTLAADTGADEVTCTRAWDPASLAEESLVADALAAAGVRLIVHESQYLLPPPALTTGDGRPYRVFTPFHRAWALRISPERPLDAPAALLAPESWPASASLPGEHGAVSDWWRPGESGAHERLARFVAERLDSYETGRDLPGIGGTSELSPHLASGELSPRQVLWTVRGDSGSSASFIRQLAWREFSASVLHDFPELPRAPLRPEFSGLAWIDDPGGLAVWREGRTGYPLVDAGMRQLLETGWMHGRVRMAAASLLVKDLLVNWTTGLQQFDDLLVDADAAQNAFNWQWVAGTGADAAPYFRILNPVAQGKRFDPDGSYVRRWVPELAGLADRWIHSPWTAPRDQLRAAGIELGVTYPEPVVDHAEARQRVLAAYGQAKGAAAAAARGEGYR